MVVLGRWQARLDIDPTDDAGMPAPLAQPRRPSAASRTTREEGPVSYTFVSRFRILLYTGEYNKECYVPATSVGRSARLFLVIILKKNF